MFCVQLAGIVIEIDNRYEHIHRICKDYIVEGKEPSFTVHVTEEEILAEQNGDTFFQRDSMKENAFTAKCAPDWLSMAAF